MKTEHCDSFQHTVSQYLIRHRSILDVLSKFQETNARTNRAVAKAITSCGCLSVEADKQPLTPQLSYEEFRQQATTHLKGKICEHCREIIESEIGSNLFYLAALCDLLNLDLVNIMEKEQSRINTLGIFNLY